MKPLLIFFIIFAAGLSGPTAKAVSIPAADYKVTYVNGIFGTYGTIRRGAVLRIDANALLEETPRMLELKDSGVITLERLSNEKGDARNQEPLSRRLALKADAPPAPDR